MSFTDAEKVDIRRHCGFAVYGSANQPAFGHRFLKQEGTLEFVLNNLGTAEETVTRTYVTNCNALEAQILTSADNMDTLSAGIFQANPREHEARERLYGAWRHKLCEFLGVNPGPGLRGGCNVSMRM